MTSQPMKAIALLAIFSLVSCAEKQVTTAIPKTMEDRLNQKQGFKQDSDGNWVPLNDKRSALDGKVSSYFQEKDTKFRDHYKTKNVDKKSWSGEKNFETKDFKTSKDGQRFAKDSRYSGKNASEQGNSSSQEGDQKSYDTHEFATNRAKEQKSSQFATQEDAAIRNRRDSFEQPDVMEWRAYREMSIEQSKSLLGK